VSAPDKCTPQEEIFAAKYLECGNATTAAKFAKYSAKTAYAKGSELLKRPRVAKRIEALKSTVTKKVIVSAERVLREMCTIAFSDIRHYAIDDNRDVSLAAGAPDSAMRAIKKLKRKVRSDSARHGPRIRKSRPRSSSGTRTPSSPRSAARTT
jgi:phage terminase small subunit